MHGRFVGASGARTFTQAVDAAHIAGGHQHGTGGGKKAGGFAFVGLQNQGNLAIVREAVDAAVGVGGKQELVGQRQQVVGVFFLRTPKCLDGVVGVDAIDGGAVHAG